MFFVPICCQYGPSYKILKWHKMIVNNIIYCTMNYTISESKAFHVLIRRKTEKAFVKNKKGSCCNAYVTDRTKCWQMLCNLSWNVQKYNFLFACGCMATNKWNCKMLYLTYQGMCKNITFCLHVVAWKPANRSLITECFYCRVKTSVSLTFLYQSFIIYFNLNLTSGW